MRPLEAFKSISLRTKVLVFLYVAYLTVPMQRKLRRAYEAGVPAKSTTNSRPKQWEETEVGDRNWLPQLGRAGKLYYILSTLTHAMNFIVNSTFLYLDHTPNKTSQEVRTHKNSRIWSLLCLAPRFIIHEVLEQPAMVRISWIFSALHLVWRPLVLVFEREFALNPIMFLLVDAKRTAHLSEPRSALTFYQQHNNTLDPIRAMLFYKVHLDYGARPRVQFYLRPNRTSEARALLARVVESAALSSAVAYGLVLIVALPPVLVTFLLRQQLFYAGCQESFLDLVHLGRILGSASLSLLLAFECLGALIYPVAIGAVLIVDLLTYWAHIERELAKLEVQFKVAHEESVSDRINMVDTLTHQWTSLLDTRSPNRPKAKRFKRFATKADEASAAAYQLQCMICDFFEELRQADQFISITLAFAFGIWLSCNAVVTFIDLGTVNTSSRLIIRALQLLGLAVLTVLTSLILVLKRKTAPCYGTICSLMAHDGSLDKGRWTVLLKYYTGRERHAFTIMHTKVFTLGTFLKTFSYTFTFSLYLQSFMISPKVSRQ